jgi:Domain of unknown function (DUF4386)
MNAATIAAPPGGPIAPALASAQSEPTTASTRRTAVLVALLFLTATVTFSVADSLIKGVLNHSDYLTSASTHAHTLEVGALLALVEGPATVGIAVLLFPLLKRTSEPLALAFIGFRVAELAAALLYVAAPLLAVRLGNGIHNGTVAGSASHDLGPLIGSFRTTAIVFIYVLTSLGGTILAYLLYRSQLVPRPIAICGLIGYPILLLGCILTVFNVGSLTGGPGLVVLVPGGLFELILPIWLLAKGFTFDGSASV